MSTIQEETSIYITRCIQKMDVMSPQREIYVEKLKILKEGENNKLKSSL